MVVIQHLQFLDYLSSDVRKFIDFIQFEIFVMISANLFLSKKLEKNEDLFIILLIILIFISLGIFINGIRNSNRRTIRDITEDNNFMTIECVNVHRRKK